MARCVAAYGPAVIDLPVCVGVHPRLPARRRAVRVAQEVATQRRRALPADARRRGHAVRAEWRRRAAWTRFCTTVPPARWSAAEVLVVARVRGQGELVCKVWKSAGPRAPSRSAQPGRGRCEG